VDVESKCICLGRLDWEYATLSYVWGNEEMFKTTGHNLQSLQGTEGFEMHYDRLPKTTQDAILCTKRLGIRYLWVDSLCIIQDDERDKLHQIQNMGLIYSHAQVTLIAAEGNNANSGLPGVRPDSRSINQLSTSVGSLDFALTLPSPKAAFVGSPWGSRGWTFQEFALSKRVLFFSRYQVYFQCRSDTWCEDTDFESRDASAIDHSYRHDIHDGYLDMLRTLVIPTGTQEYIVTLFKTYTKLVRNYTRRFLSDETDYLHAFSGIEDMVQSLYGMTLLWGLPIEAFETALFWVPLEGKKFQRRQVRHTDQSNGSIRQIPFPSWSWIGWIGPVGYFRSMDVQPSHSWVYKSMDGNIRTINNRKNEDLQSEEVLPHGSSEGSAFPPVDLPLGVLAFQTTCATFSDAEIVRINHLQRYTGYHRTHTDSDGNQLEGGSHAVFYECILIGKERRTRETSETRVVLMVIYWEGQIAYKIAGDAIISVNEKRWLEAKPKIKTILLG
jgi:hypothetical protein